MTAQMPTTYKSLFQQVKQTLILGQQRIEAQRVKTYWETGRLIHADILKHADRAQYGAEVIKRLADDLNIHVRLLQRCVQFARTYSRPPIASARTQLSWSHYRELITIPDPGERMKLEERMTRGHWSTDELSLRIKGHKNSRAVPETKEKAAGSQELLIPKRGELYTYQIIKRPELGSGQASDLLLDLGFGMFKRISPRLQSRFVSDQIVESDYDVKEENYSLRASGRTAKDLFTFQAVVEKVIDADTVKVRIDLGFDLEHREILRLRDLDAPEVGTKEGDAARNFVRSLLKEASLIVLRSSRSDKYDRYLADVFIPQGNEPDPATDVYLNNVLLQEGHAWRA